MKMEVCVRWGTYFWDMENVTLMALQTSPDRGRVFGQVCCSCVGNLKEYVTPCLRQFDNLALL